MEKVPRPNLELDHTQEKANINTIFDNRDKAYIKLSEIDSLLNQRVVVSMAGSGGGKNSLMTSLLLDAHEKMNLLDKEWPQLVNKKDEPVVEDQIKQDGDFERGWKTYKELDLELQKVKTKLHKVYSDFNSRLENNIEVQRQSIKSIKEFIKTQVIIDLNFENFNDPKKIDEIIKSMGKSNQLLKQSLDVGTQKRLELKQQAEELYQQAIELLVENGSNDFKNAVKIQIIELTNQKIDFLKNNELLQDFDIETIKREIIQELMQELKIDINPEDKN